MREHPILMQGPLVLATLNGIKTQTRRPLRCLSNDEHMGKLLGDWHLSNPPYQYDGGPLWRWKGKREPKAGDWVEKVQTDVDDTISVPVKGMPSVGDRLWVRETWQHFQNIGQRAAHFHEHQKSPANCFYRADESNPRTKPLSGRWRPSLLMPRWACRLVLPLVSVRVERVQDITEDDAKAEGVEPIGGSYREGFREVWQSIYGTWDLNHWVWVAECAEIEVSK